MPVDNPPPDNPPPESLSDEDREAEARLLAFLSKIGVATTLYRHPPVFTVDEAQEHMADLPGLHVKNMFLKDRKGALWLVTCLDARRIRIRDLEKVLGVAKMSFAKPELLWEALAVRPGSVTPLALLADRETDRVRFALDAAVVDAALVNCHPLHNAATVALSYQGLSRFLDVVGKTPVIVDFDALEALAAAH